MNYRFGHNDNNKYIDDLHELTEFNTIAGEEYHLNNICDDCSSGSSLTDNDSDADIDDIDDIDGRDMNIRCFLSVVSVSFF